MKFNNDLRNWVAPHEAYRGTCNILVKPLLNLGAKGTQSRPHRRHPSSHRHNHNNLEPMDTLESTRKSEVSTTDPPRAHFSTSPRMQNLQLHSLPSIRTQCLPYPILDQTATRQQIHSIADLNRNLSP